MKIAKNIPRNLLLCCGAYYFSSAIVAIGHKILILAHYMLQHNTPFRELGPNTTNGFVHRAFPNHLSVDYNASASKSR